MTITSPQNPTIKQWRRLHTRSGRREQRLFLAEGPHLIEEAWDAGIAFEAVVFAPGAETSPVLRQLPADVPRLPASAAVVDALAETQSPQGLVAVCHLPASAGFPPKPESGAGHLVLEGVQDPGHVGTLIRTALGAGITRIVLGPGTADPWGGKALRSSMGAVFRVAAGEIDIAGWLDSARAAGVRVLGSGVGPGSMDYRAAARDATLHARGWALVLGNEGAGMSEESSTRCDAILAIPLRGPVESLSVAVAGGVLLFELAGGKQEG